MRALLRLVLLVAALVFAPLPVARAGDPAAPDFEKSLQRCRELVKAEQWPAGEAALRKVFTDFPEDPRVRARLREIEDQLKVCLFRRVQKPPTGEELFGPAAVKFNASLRDVEFFFAHPTEPLWTTSESGVRVLGVRFESTLVFEASSIRYLSAQDRVAAVFICYDIEKRGGYVVSPGYFRSTATGHVSADSGVRKIAASGTVELKNQASSASDYSDDVPLRVTRNGSDIQAFVGRKLVAKVSDRSYTSGYLGVVADSIGGITVKGRIDKHAFRKLVAEKYAERFAAWLEDGWSREKEIPDWARDSVVAAPDMTLSELPSDGPSEERAALTAMVEAAANGDEEEALHAAIRSAELPRLTGLYLRGVADLALGSHAAASDAFDELVAAEPEFVPARMFRGIARFHMRKVADARADIDWTLERRPRAAPAIVAAALIAIFEQDLLRADAVLARADSLGVLAGDLDEVRDWVHRMRRGPNFAQRFEHASDHFVVVSDHSKQVCVDAATLLESMQGQYAAALKPAPPGAPKARVYVFSGPEGYFDYADELYVQADSSAGVYLPMLRELAIWIPVDMTDFRDTVRHEGFHQYLHRHVDDAPLWFNEGYAEVMGGGGPEGIRNAARDGESVRKFVPVRELVAMKAARFMAIAEVTYTESRYLVDFLRRTKSAKLKTVLRDYFTALAAGLSHADANRKVLDPVMDVLEAEFKASL